MTGPLAAQRVREVRARQFAENGFGDGDYDDRFVVLRVDGVPVLTGSATRWRGEGEIGAWELGSGCRDHRTARKWDDGLLDRSVGALRHELGLDAAV